MLEVVILEESVQLEVVNKRLEHTPVEQEPEERSLVEERYNLDRLVAEAEVERIHRIQVAVVDILEVERSLAEVEHNRLEVVVDNLEDPVVDIVVDIPD